VKLGGNKRNYVGVRQTRHKHDFSFKTFDGSFFFEGIFENLLNYNPIA